MRAIVLFIYLFLDLRHGEGGYAEGGNLAPVLASLKVVCLRSARRVWLGDFFGGGVFWWWGWLVGRMRWIGGWMDGWMDASLGRLGGELNYI